MNQDDVHRLCRRYIESLMHVVLKFTSLSVVKTRRLIAKYVENDLHKCWLSLMRYRNDQLRLNRRKLSAFYDLAR